MESHVTFKIQFLVSKYLFIKSSWKQCLKTGVENSSCDPETSSPLKLELRYANREAHSPLLTDHSLSYLDKEDLLTVRRYQ